jgi:hypothetical protein
MISVEKNLKSQKQESPVVAMFVNRSGRNEQFYRGPSIDTSYQVSVHLCASGFRGEYFKNQPIRNKSFLPNFCSFGQAVSEKIFKNLYRDNCILNTDIYI